MFTKPEITMGDAFKSKVLKSSLGDERRQPVRRESTSTIESEKAEEKVNQQRKDKWKLESKQVLAYSSVPLFHQSTSFNISQSHDIKIGDNITNVYHHYYLKVT